MRLWTLVLGSLLCGSAALNAEPLRTLEHCIRAKNGFEMVSVVFLNTSIRGSDRVRLVADIPTDVRHSIEVSRIAGGTSTSEVLNRYHTEIVPILGSDLFADGITQDTANCKVRGTQNYDCAMYAMHLVELTKALEKACVDDFRKAEH